MNDPRSQFPSSYPPPPPPPPGPPPLPTPGPPPQPGRFKRWLAPLGVAGVLLWKLKAVFVPLLKFGKFIPAILKTGGTMLLSIWVYALSWGWKFAVGFVLLIFVHECGHLLVARRFGMNVSAPMFIPFV